MISQWTTRNSVKLEPIRMYRLSLRPGRPAVAAGLRTAGGRRSASGLTLLELVVVLVILSIVATAAVQALQPRAENARYETTRSTLDNIRLAAIGAPGRTAGGRNPADSRLCRRRRPFAAPRRGRDEF